MWVKHGKALMTSSGLSNGGASAPKSIFDGHEITVVKVKTRPTSGLRAFAFLKVKEIFPVFAGLTKTLPQKKRRPKGRLLPADVQDQLSLVGRHSR